MTTQYYYIVADDCEGNNRDLLVEAENLDQAIKLWQDYWFDPELYESHEELGLELHSVHLVPERTGTSHAVPWWDEKGMITELDLRS